MIELVLKITAKASGAPAMVHALESVMFQARLERACVDCRLYAEAGNPQSLLYVEQWSTLRDLESQLRSRRFGMLLAIMETAPQAPALEVRTIAGQRGLEYVSAVRLAAGDLSDADVGRPSTSPGSSDGPMGLA